MTAERLAELDALCATATDGPWLVGRPDGGPAVIPSGLDDAGWPHLTIYTHSMGDAAFIAAARFAVPDLLAEVRRLRAELAAHEEKDWERNDHRP